MTYRKSWSIIASVTETRKKKSKKGETMYQRVDSTNSKMLDLNSKIFD